MAIGSDETRARLLGVRIPRRKVQAYAASGLLAALAALWVTGQTQSGSPDGGDQFITSFWGIFFQGLILIIAVTFNSLIQARSRG